MESDKDYSVLNYYLIYNRIHSSGILIRQLISFTGMFVQLDISKVGMF